MIRAANLTRFYGDFKAVDGVSVASLGLVVILACASADVPAQRWHPSESERVDTLATAWETFDEFDRNLSNLCGDFENFDETTRFELTIRRDQLVEMQRHLRQLLYDLEFARAERWRILEAEIGQTIEEMDRIFDQINSLLGPNDIYDTLA